MEDDFKRLVDALRDAKDAAPQLRLGQLIAAVALSPGAICPDIALIKDAELERLLRNFAAGVPLWPRQS